MMDCLFWPAVQFVNFKYLPGQYRVVYVSVFAIFWNAFLSKMKHSETGSKNEEIVPEITPQHFVSKTED
eukprot:Pgem_evm1s18818